MSYEFLCNYQDIHATFEDPGKAPAAKGTWAKLIEQYKESRYFENLSEQSKSSYRTYLSLLEEYFGDIPVALLTTPEVYDLQEALQDTPRKADYVISVLSRLITYGIKKGYRNDNPALKVEKISKPEGHRPWEDFEITAFRKKWKPDTVERIAFELLLSTGQRGGDVIKMTRQFYRKGWIKVRQEKTDELVDIPAAKALADILDPWLENHPHMMLITNSRGAQFKKRNFQKIMRDAYKECGFGLDVTTHGLRYTAATILHELGLDWEVIASITGHSTMQMVKKYTRKKRLAARAIAKLDENQIGTKL
ncbi:tyrosine-type recombinase/integrase [Sneathiella glossodoripedis]|uniref:tyrosine-type recombinase/integrase n=1 Tax=Sneathiella glossodoripedis TaxID=418853 RepID=UPI000470312A|nr:tyrosine-type recombinase/integrase [Sneathiella glossodoripedis]